MYRTPRILHTLRTSNFPRQDSIAVTLRRTAALTTTEPRLPLVQPTLGGLRRLMFQTTEDRRDSSITLTCRYHLHQVIGGRRIRIPIRRDSRNINPLQAPLIHQGIIPLEAYLQPIRTISSSLW